MLNTFESVQNAADHIRPQLNKALHQALSDVRRWQSFSRIAASFAFLLCIVGLVTLLIGKTDSSLLTIVSSSIPSMTAILFFKQAKAAEKRVDAIISQSVKTEVNFLNKVSQTTKSKKTT
jgi:hypothetical protein